LSYFNEQEFQKVGFFGYADFKYFSPHIIFSIEKYSDIQQGTDFSISTVDQAFDYKDDRVLLNVGNSFHFIDSKLNVLVRYLSFLRDNDPEVTRILTSALGTESFIYPAQKRATITIQATPHEDLYFELGAGFDLDKDNANGSTIPDRIFDKGFGKFILRF
ncbi:unnamed protein product, partial [Chrysoparadoxa australica]